MGLLDSPPLDPGSERRRARLRYGALGLVALLILSLPLLFLFRNFREERAVDKFLSAVERKDFRDAFAVWNADPAWEQHTAKYKDYPFGQFQLDWGPSGEYGEIKSHKVEGSVTPRSKLTDATGVVVAVRINGRAEPACLWVERKTRAISFSPLPCTA